MVGTIAAERAVVELKQINRKLDNIMATQAEAAAQLKTISTELVKVGTETQTLLDKVTALQDAAANADNVSPELQAAIEAVATQATKVDDLVPDVQATPQTPPVDIQVSTPPTP